MRMTPYRDYGEKQLAGKRVIRFGRQMSAEVSAKEIVLNSEGCAEFTLVTPAGEIRINLPILGEHNITNALAASACAIACDVGLAEIRRQARSNATRGQAY